MSTSFPLGEPTNRPPPPAPTPIEGRPNWYRDKDGKELYREPPPPSTKS